MSAEKPPGSGNPGSANKGQPAPGGAGQGERESPDRRGIVREVPIGMPGTPEEIRRRKREAEIPASRPEPSVDPAQEDRPED